MDSKGNFQRFSLSSLRKDWWNDVRNSFCFPLVITCDGCVRMKGIFNQKCSSFSYRRVSDWWNDVRNLFIVVLSALVHRWMMMILKIQFAFATAKDWRLITRRHRGHYPRHSFRSLRSVTRYFVSNHNWRARRMTYADRLWWSSGIYLSL